MNLLQGTSATAVATLSGHQLGIWLGFRGFLTHRFPKTVASVRHSGDHGKRLKPSGFYGRHCLSLIKFYILLAGIPEATGITLVNIFIEHWEYFKNPAYGPWYQYQTVDKVLIDYSPKATPNNLSFISLNTKYILIRVKLINKYILNFCFCDE
ncbi:unnamed protein product [Nyctereutes procyonoides]|uniref:NADH dehydrogenase [ubiquinone] 1 beta subcomplex subunit 5, mitochondrial n=1 Tax=Nyctereutes procyonoides TaxID=34880 RepID=A0A811YCF4_NYCPR|nr:unnamed protein product [Nyctereutes procyonoides]